MRAVNMWCAYSVQVVCRWCALSVYVFCRGAQAVCSWCTGCVQVVAGNVQVTSVEEGHTFHLGDRSIKVLHLPGHSPGSLVQRANCCTAVLDIYTITPLHCNTA